MNLIIPGFLRHTKLWFAIALAVLLMACQGKPIHQAYEGPAKPDDQTASLIIPESFNLLYIDRIKYESLLGGDGAHIKTLPGSHEYILKFQEYWDTMGGDSHERVESNPLSIAFEAKAGQTYQIKFNKPANLKESMSYSKNPAIEIINTTDNTKVDANISYNLLTKSALGGLFKFGVASAEDQPSSQQQTDKPSATMTSPATTTTTAIATPAAPSVTTETEEDTSTKVETKEDGRALEMLKYWWESASENQKKAFQDWMGK